MNFWKFGFLISILAISCNKQKADFVVNGLRPIYLSETELYDIKNIDSMPIINPGVINIWGSFFFMVDQKRGIHVYDKSNPNNILYYTFLNIPGAMDFKITNSYLYVDNTRDLLVIDISNLKNIVLKSTIKNATNQQFIFPPDANQYFECVDPNKGVVKEWEQTTLINPKCKTN